MAAVGATLGWLLLTVLFLLTSASTEFKRSWEASTGDERVEAVATYLLAGVIYVAVSLLLVMALRVLWRSSIAPAGRRGAWRPTAPAAVSGVSRWQRHMLAEDPFKRLVTLDVADLLEVGRACRRTPPPRTVTLHTSDGRLREVRAAMNEEESRALLRASPAVVLHAGQVRVFAWMCIAPWNLTSSLSIYRPGQGQPAGTLLAEWEHPALEDTILVTPEGMWRHPRGGKHEPRIGVGLPPEHRARGLLSILHRRAPGSAVRHVERYRALLDASRRTPAGEGTDPTPFADFAEEVAQVLARPRGRSGMFVGDGRGGVRVLTWSDDSRARADSAA